MSRVNLITGASGFIGRRLSTLLEQRGETCVHVDRDHGFDLAVPGWSQRLPDARIDAVFHLAQSRRYREFPDGTADMTGVNLTATAELLDWSRRHGVQTFVQTSTGTVYEPSLEPLTETSPCAAISFYAATKRAAELLAEPYAAYFQVVLPRLFGVYGAGARNTLLADMVDRVATGKPITLTGGVGIYLTPIYVEDCVDVLAALADGRLERRFEVTNVAGEERLSLTEMVQEIGRQLGREPNATSTPGTPPSLCADISRLRAIYGRTFTPFVAGLGQTLNCDPAANRDRAAA